MLGWHGTGASPARPAAMESPSLGHPDSPGAPGQPQPAVLHQLQRRHWWHVEERVNLHQYQLLPARSKQQCPALWAEQLRGIYPMGNWISQPCLKGTEGWPVTVKWFMCGTPGIFSAHPLLAAGSNGFCLNPGTGMWVWVLCLCSWGLHIYSL